MLGMGTYVRATFLAPAESLVHARENIGIQAVFRYWLYALRLVLRLCYRPRDDMSADP